MNRPPKLALLFVGAAVVGHVGLVLAVPHVIMGTAIKRASKGGAVINEFQFGPRTTKDSRWVVRPSPDLAYSTCVYDLAGGPLLVTSAPNADHGYSSLSVFAANTDNIAVFDSSQNPAGIRFVLAHKGQKVPGGEKVVYSPSDRGIVLDRRLAPSVQLFALADQARRSDSCARVGI